MAILNRDYTEFKTVDKVFYGNGRVQKVWVHDGTKYLLVKGRLLEAVWEKDLSTYGGTSWDNINIWYEPEYNVLKSMLILDDGDLMGVVDYVIGNGTPNQYGTDKRYSLIKLSSTDGSISPFSTYTNWSKWSTAVENYKYTAYPLGVIRCGNYYLAYSEHGILYVFDLNGNYMSRYENTTWHTHGSCKLIQYPMISVGVKMCYDSVRKCVYYAYSDENINDVDSDNYLTSIYRAGIVGSNIYTPRRHYKGERVYTYLYYCTSVIVDEVNGNCVACFDDNANGNSKLVVFNCASSYGSTSTDFSALCSCRLHDGEPPIAIKDGYLYTLYLGKAIRKRRISDLSLIWSVNVPEVYTTGDCNGGNHQMFPECDGGFMLPNGCVIYPDGYVTKERRVVSNKDYASTIRGICFDETKGIGYMMAYSQSNKVCSVVKVKEVKK